MFTVHICLQGADAISTGRILETVVRMCFEAGQFDLLNENIIQLTKKRGQLKQVLVFSLLCCLCTQGFIVLLSCVYDSPFFYITSLSLLTSMILNRI